MAKEKYTTPAIKDPIWINENQAAQIGYNLMEGIPDELNKYVKTVEGALPQLSVEDGVIVLEDLWLETSLPRDLLRHIIKHHRFAWPYNVERIRLEKEKFVNRPKIEQEEPQA